MKYAVLACFLVSAVSTAAACDLMGVKGHISDDGQSITSRQPIALKAQAKLYGGYQQAADYIEKNRQSVMYNDKFSQAVKQQVDNDLSLNVQQLKCWAEACSKNSTDPACAL
jgi:hypothetical protein